MYIFGGYDGRARFNDLYKFKMRQKKYKWKRIQAEGTVPLNRFGHSAVVCNNCMFVIGGWNGHDTMDDVYQYSFLSNLWFEVRRIKGVRPKPRYRHSAVEYKKSIIIFGGVDTNQQRFNDLYSFNIEQRSWQAHSVTGHIPQSRTFHKSILIKNVMYIVGGFDGSRLNDLYHIALEKYEDSGRLSVRSDSDESVASHMRRGPPTSAASGIMQTVPSDLSVDQISQSDYIDTNANNPNEYLDP
jgi:N-acetylneuraminic acid mutarotase